MTNLTPEEMQIALRLKRDFVYYAERCLFIRTKGASIQALKLNKGQLYLHQIAEGQKGRTGKVRIIILKGRQMGLSTYIEGRFYAITSQNRGIRAFILTHSSEATKNLFEMAQRYHENCPEVIRERLGRSNAKELIFDKIDSGYRIGTAGTKDVGRSSTIQLFHGSEVAFWEHGTEHAKGIMQAIPDLPGTESFLESTANGIGNYFHEQWQMAEAGQSDYIPVFIPWFWDSEYRKEVNAPLILTDEEIEIKNYHGLTKEQLAWRRNKIIELSVGGIDGRAAFRQEYPCTSVEAFEFSGDDSFISPDDVMHARKLTGLEAIGALRIGVDVARYGTDRTVIVRRRGRVVYNVQTYTKLDTMQICGHINQLIILEQPDKVFIDVIGVGAGVYDRLRELGHERILCAVNNAESALMPDRYINKRAETWGLMNQMLKERNCIFPDDDALHADLIGVKYSFDSQNRLKLESKDDMKKRGLRSPDIADAIALTYALPESALYKQMDRKKEEASRQLMNNFHRLNKARSAAHKR